MARAHRRWGCTVCVALVGLGAAAQAAPVGKVLGSIPSPGPCVTGLTWDGKYLWAADHKTDQLYRVDRRDGRVVQRVPSPGYRPAGLAWVRGMLWNVDPVAGKLYRVDVKRGVTDHTVDAPVAEASALAWDGRYLWLASPRSRRLHRVDESDGTTVDRHRTPAKQLNGMTFDGRYLWLSDREKDRLHVLDPATGEVLFTIKSPGPHPTGIAFDGRHLWVADYQTDRIYRVEHRGDDRPLRRARKHQEVVYTHQVRNLGPGKLLDAEVYLAIPGDGPSQQLHGPVRFAPTPERVLKDQWGQRVAKFRFTNLPAGRFATVVMRARATLYDVRHAIYPHRVKPLSAVPADVRRLYLRDGAKYAIKDPVIRRAVRKALADGKQKNPYVMARRIYRHVHRKMHYELSGGWNVAPRVLARGSGSCSEYSFVFIAMCRAAGIPARYAGALVVRDDDASFDDVFHRWVELYLPGYGWVPVDPSRGDKPSEVARADAFGHLEPAFLITTRGGGGSKYLTWRYNSDERWTCRGRCAVTVETIAEWTPLPAKASSPKP